jgi:hypothetical protein
VTWLFGGSAVGLFVAPLLAYSAWAVADPAATSWRDAAAGVVSVWFASIVVLMLLGRLLGPDGGRRVRRPEAIRGGAVSACRLFRHGLVYGGATGLAAVAAQIAAWAVWPVQIMRLTRIDNEQVYGGYVMGAMILIWLAGFTTMFGRLDRLDRRVAGLKP